MEDQVSEVERALLDLYGTSALLTRGVLHVSSSVRGPDGQLHVIRIGEHAPKSSRDFFVLNLCRARCDAILTTAQNLRAEPQLRHTLQGPLAPALASYREQAGKLSAPCCAIMTRSGDLPLSHAVFGDGTHKLVLTSPEAAPGLRARLGALAEVLPVEQLDARSACALLRARGLGLISVEAGPSASAPLYDPPSVVDELLLSICEAPLASALVGGRLPAPDLLFAGRMLVHETVRQEESGRWRFQRWLSNAQAA